MTSKEESEMLMKAILPVAEKMLQEFGEFYPYAGYLTMDGEIVHLGAREPEDDFPKARDLIYLLRTFLLELMKAGQYKAAALVWNATIKMPKSRESSDAIQVCIQHANGYSVEVFFPYRIVDQKVTYSETFAQQGNDHFGPL
jgi:hypothetical protein